MVDINYGAVLVAAIIEIVLGFLWYGPFFGKMQTKATGGSYVIMIIGALLTSWVLATFITSGEAHYGIWTASYGVHIALYVWFGFILPITVGSVLWEKKPWSAWFINIGYYLVSLIIIGALLGAWH